MVEKVIKVHADDEHAFEKLKEDIAGSMFPHLCTRVESEFLRYVERRLAKMAIETADVILGADQGYREFDPEQVLSVCQKMALLYVGRRSGLLNLIEIDPNSSGDTPRRDNLTVSILTNAANDLATAVGEKRAACIFRKLQAIADRVVEEELGPKR